MHIKEKIRFLPYFSLSFLTMFGLWVVCISWAERIAVSTVTLATMVNHWILIKSVSSMIESAVTNDEQLLRKIKKRALIIYIVKLLVLLIALSLSVQLMGNRVIIAVANYFVLLVIFTFSIKRGEK